jgi:hypothetical protein
MGVTATNLIAGAASLHVGDFGAVEPLDTAVATDLDDEVWRDLGGTQDGVTLTVSREFFRLAVDQVIDAPGRRLTERDVTVSTNLAEGTLENLALAMSQAEASVTVGGTGATGFAAMDLLGDDSGAEPDYVAVILRGRAPAGKKRNVIIRKALSIEEVESAYTKDNQTLIPVTFAAHWVSPTVRPVRVVDERPSA